MPAQPGPLVPRSVVTIITLAIVGAMIWTAVQGDYRATIVLAIVVLFILGADLGSLARAWRGTPPDPPKQGTP